MAVPSLSMSQLMEGVKKYEEGVRPWRQTLNRVDWFILIFEKLYPLKYTYALAVGEPPATYTTNQMKSVLKKLPIEFISLNEQSASGKSFEDKVNKSLFESEHRSERLKSASKTPPMKLVYRAEFVRNPDVVAEVLCRAKGKCESCGKPAPFKRSKDGKPYLEVHHKIFLSDGGEDSVENAEALCPNCHRQKHFGQWCD